MYLKGTQYGEVIEPGQPTTAEITAGFDDARDIDIEGMRWSTWRLNAKFMDNKLAFTLGADNLLDQYPDRVPNNRVLPTGVVNLNATNALGYSRYSPYGFNGRFVYARFGFHW